MKQKMLQNRSFSSKTYWKMRPLQKRLGRQSLSNAMPKRRQIVDSCILFLTTSRSTEPPKRMPKSRHIVDSLTLLFTTSRSTEAAKHDAQSETNRRFSQSPFHDVQVDRRSQTRFPSRDYGRHNLKKYRFSMNVGRREAANLGTCRVIKNNKGNFTHCHPVWTPVYTL